MRTRIFGLAACSLLALLTACGANAPDAVETTRDALIGGQPGGPPQVGALDWVSADGTQEVTCSGTLVAPDLVLAARHCAYDRVGQALPEAGRWVFTLSPSNDRTTWTDAHAVVELMVPPLVDVKASVDWAPPLGEPDLALLRIANPITNVPPLAVSFEPVGFEQPKFVVSGYGFGAHDGTPSAGRSVGTTTLLALEGQPAHLVYPTLAAFTQAVSDALKFPVSQFDAVDLAKIGSWYDLTLAKGYEARLGADPSDAAPCHGDSGSPLLQMGPDNAYRVYGVDQGTIDPNPATRVCDFGPFVTLLTNPTARAFLEAHGLGGAPPVGSGGAGGGGGAGSAGVAGGAGSTSSSLAGAAPASAGLGNGDAEPTEPGGCSVANAGTERGFSALLALFGLSLGLARRARRRLNAGPLARNE